MERLHKVFELVDFELFVIDYFGYVKVDILDLLDQIGSLGHNSLLLGLDSLEIRLVILDEFLLRGRDYCLMVKS